MARTRWPEAEALAREKREARVRAVHRYQQAHAAAGLCRQCNRKRAEGSSQCEVCLERGRERWQRWAADGEAGIAWLKRRKCVGKAQRKRARLAKGMPVKLEIES